MGKIESKNDLNDPKFKELFKKAILPERSSQVKMPSNHLTTVYFTPTNFKQKLSSLCLLDTSQILTCQLISTNLNRAVSSNLVTSFTFLKIAEEQTLVLEAEVLKFISTFCEFLEPHIRVFTRIIKNFFPSIKKFVAEKVPTTPSYFEEFEQLLSIPSISSLETLKQENIQRIPFRPDSKNDSKSPIRSRNKGVESYNTNTKIIQNSIALGKPKKEIFIKVNLNSPKFKKQKQSPEEAQKDKLVKQISLKKIPFSKEIFKLHHSNSPNTIKQHSTQDSKHQTPKDPKNININIKLNIFNNSNSPQVKNPKENRKNVKVQTKEDTQKMVKHSHKNTPLIQQKIKMSKALSKNLTPQRSKDQLIIPKLSSKNSPSSKNRKTPHFHLHKPSNSLDEDGLNLNERFSFKPKLQRDLSTRETETRMSRSFIQHIEPKIKHL